jgi:hypothetical protein
MHRLRAEQRIIQQFAKGRGRQGGEVVVEDVHTTVVRVHLPTDARIAGAEVAGGIMRRRCEFRNGGSVPLPRP